MSEQLALAGVHYGLVLAARWDAELLCAYIVLVQ